MVPCLLPGVYESPSHGARHAACARGRTRTRRTLRRRTRRRLRGQRGLVGGGGAGGGGGGGGGRSRRRGGAASSAQRRTGGVPGVCGERLRHAAAGHRAPPAEGGGAAAPALRAVDADGEQPLAASQALPGGPHAKLQLGRVQARTRLGGVDGGAALHSGPRRRLQRVAPGELPQAAVPGGRGSEAQGGELGAVACSGRAAAQASRGQGRACAERSHSSAEQPPFGAPPARPAPRARASNGCHQRPVRRVRTGRHLRRPHRRHYFPHSPPDGTGAAAAVNTRRTR